MYDFVHNAHKCLKFYYNLFSLIYTIYLCTESLASRVIVYYPDVAAPDAPQARVRVHGYTLYSYR